MNYKTAPSLLSSNDQQASKKQSMLGTLDSVSKPHRAANAKTYPVPSNHWLIWLSVSTLLVIAFYYMIEQTQNTPVQSIAPTKNQAIPLNVTEQPLAKLEIASTQASYGTEGSEANTSSSADNTAKIVDAPESVQAAFSSLQENEELVKIEDKTDMPSAAAASISAAPKPKTNAITKHKAVKLAEKTKMTKTKSAVKKKVNEGDIAVIKALLDNGKVSSIQETAANAMSAKSLAQAPAAKSTIISRQDSATKEARLDDMIKQKTQSNGAMDLSSMSDPTFDQAAYDMQKCAALNFIQKPFCEHKVCEQYKGKSALCDAPTAASKEPSTKQASAASPSNQLYEQAKTTVTTQAEQKAKQSITDAISQKASALSGEK